MDVCFATPSTEPPTVPATCVPWPFMSSFPSAFTAVKPYHSPPSKVHVINVYTRIDDVNVDTCSIVVGRLPAVGAATWWALVDARQAPQVACTGVLRAAVWVVNCGRRQANDLVLFDEQEASASFLLHLLRLRSWHVRQEVNSHRLEVELFLSVARFLRNAAPCARRSAPRLLRRVWRHSLTRRKNIRRRWRHHAWMTSALEQVRSKYKRRFWSCIFNLQLFSRKI